MFDSPSYLFCHYFLVFARMYTETRIMLIWVTMIIGLVVRKKWKSNPLLLSWRMQNTNKIDKEWNIETKCVPSKQFIVYTYREVYKWVREKRTGCLNSKVFIDGIVVDIMEQNLMLDKHHEGNGGCPCLLTPKVKQFHRFINYGFFHNPFLKLKSSLFDIQKKCISVCILNRRCVHKNLIAG